MNRTVQKSHKKGASIKETPCRHFSCTRYPGAASEVNAESPRGFTGQEDLAKAGVTINPHVSSRSAKEMGDETPIQGDDQMYATMDPAAFQTIMDQTLRHSSGIIVQTLSQTLNQKTGQFKKVFTELNQRSKAGDRSSEACLNKLRPAPYS